MKSYEENLENMTFNLVTVSEDTDDVQRTEKIAIVAKQWNVSDDYSKKTEAITEKTWGTKLSAFPYIFYVLGEGNKKGAKGNNYPLEATVCMLISWLMDNLKGFVGIPKDF